MPSYLVTGVSRGVGWGFLEVLSEDQNNTVIGLGRNSAKVQKAIDEKLPGRSNIHLVESDITDPASLETAAAETAKITGRGIDYLIANAGIVPTYDAYDPIDYLASDPAKVEKELMTLFRVNVVGQIHLFHAFIPLLRLGEAKKVIAMSTGQAALDIIPQLKIDVASLYAISKAAMNTAVAKYAVQFEKEGILFMSISPGMAHGEHFEDATPEEKEKLGGMLGAFVKYAPDFKGPSGSANAVRDVMKVVYGASVEKGDSGTFVSHFGNQQWL